MNHFICTGLLTIAISITAETGFAQIVIKNDSMTDAASVTPCQCFIEHEIPAAWLTSPVDGKIVAVQLFWESPFGGQSDTIEYSVQILDTATFPDAGSFLQNEGSVDAKIVGPTMQDGVLNEFRFLDPPTNSVPLSVPVSQGQTFVVGLEILNTASGFAPSLAYDDDCQTGKNTVFTIPGGWVDFCTQGSGLGDFVIRAVIEPTEPVPAVSTWAVVALCLAIAIAGTLVTTRTSTRPLTPATG